jgi:enoyl-CoA hydratase/carnithine racemase
MSYRFATYEKRGRIAYVTLNRPEVMNALHFEAHLELAAIWEDFRDDPDVWVAILTGAGERAFSAGNDLKATAERTAEGAENPAHPPDARPPFGRITRDFDCPKPMIAAVNGVAVGGGLEMALACDIIIAADHARFGLPEPRVGLFAGAGGIHRLARQLPFKVAMGLLLTGRLFGAEEAHRIGLVNDVVPLSDLMPTAERWAGEILECSPLSVQLTKESAFDGLQHSVDEALARDHERVERLLASADFVEGPKAFSEKRRPQWTGR